MLRFASRHFITIKFQPAACFLLARETKALFFFLHTLGFVFACHFYKAGSVTCFLIRRSNNFDKSFRLPARPFCYYKSSLKSLSPSLFLARLLDPLSMNLLPTAVLFAIPAGTSVLSDLTMEILCVFVCLYMHECAGEAEGERFSRSDSVITQMFIAHNPNVVISAVVYTTY